MTLPESFYAPLRHCVEQHPFLNVVVADSHTNKPFYQRVLEIDLEDHITILNRAAAAAAAQESGQWREVEKVLQGQIDLPFREGIPPWRIVVLPLPLSQQQQQQQKQKQKPSSCRALVTFVYSHTILDGPSGVAFHRTFLAAAAKSAAAAVTKPSVSAARVVATPPVALPPHFDTADQLPISWGFLLSPLLAVIVPKFLTNFLGLKAQSSNLSDDNSWTGSPCRFGSPKKLRLGVISDPLVVEKAVDLARANGARLTGLLHILILRALSNALASHLPGPESATYTNLVSQTPINMRRAGSRPRDEMGEFASIVEIAHPRPDPAISNDPMMKKISESEWELARHASQQFADAATRLTDQPIGLLRYVPNMRSWLLGKLGQRREASYELSNLGSVTFTSDNDNEENQKEGRGVRITDMTFAQPGMVAGAPICFNVISVKGTGGTGGGGGGGGGGGSLVYSTTWISGSLGLEREGEEEEEERFVDAVNESIRWGFEAAVHT